MRLECPSCGSSYDLPEDWGEKVRRAGRQLRARCRSCHAVFEVAAAPAPAPDPCAVHHPVPARAATPSLPAPPGDADAPGGRPWGGRVAVTAAGLALGLCLGALSALLAIPGATQKLARDTRLAAPVRSALALLPDRGLRMLEPAASPLRVQAVAVRRPVPAGGWAFEVTGEIRNPTGEALSAPEIELRLLRADGMILERRIIPSGQGEVRPGGDLAFSTVALNVPEQATRLAVALKPGLVDRF